MVDSRSHLYPGTERAMGWDAGETGLKIVLGAEVPSLVETYLGEDVRGLLAEHDLKIEDVAWWISHPGGPKVIEAIQSTLGLERSALELTWRSLASVGNMSSASVLHVLRDTLAERPIASGDWGLLMAMGPGFAERAGAAPMVSEWLFTALIAMVGCERVAELVIARRNLAWSVAHGGQESGFAHFPVMVALHTGLLAGCVAEVWSAHRTFVPGLGWPMLALAVLSQALRWWCIATLGRQWNTRIVVVPGLARVRGGPYRFLTHPNYVAVVVEGFALPLVHSAWITAVAFTVLNAGLLGVRIRLENAALAAAYA